MQKNKTTKRANWRTHGLMILLPLISLFSLCANATTTKHSRAQKHTSAPQHVVAKKNTKHTKYIPRVKKHRPILARAHIGQVTNAINNGNILHSNVPLYDLSRVEQRLVTFVRNTVSSLHYSNYKLGGNTIDTHRGVYVVDCSTYVDHILKTVYPTAFNSLVNGTGTDKPTSDDYYDYFVNLSDKNQKHWNMIADVEQLRPGDILVFRFRNSLGIETGGHVMVVMDQPARDDDTFTVRVADSAPTGHGEDTRLPRHSGIGIGTLLLKVNPRTYQPYAYAWKAGARWEKNVYFAMARPIATG